MRHQSAAQTGRQHYRATAERASTEGDHLRPEFRYLDYLQLETCCAVLAQLSRRKTVWVCHRLQPNPSVARPQAESFDYEKDQLALCALAFALLYLAVRSSRSRARTALRAQSHRIVRAADCHQRKRPTPYISSLSRLLPFRLSPSPSA